VRVATTGHRIFIHHSGALGDLLLSIPAINALRASDDFVHVAGRSDTVNFLREVGFIDEKSDVDSQLYLSLFTNMGDRRIKDFFSSFERAYVFTVDKYSQLVENIRTVLPHTEIIQTIPTEGFRMHVSDFRLSQFRYTSDLRQGDIYSLPVFHIPSIYEQKAKEMLVSAGYDFKRPLTAIHPGSGSRKKCWPFENFKRLIVKLKRQLNHFFILFSGPAEDMELKREIKDFATHLGKDCFYVSDLELVMVASLLSLCDFYIGNDSGITHLASSVMKRVIAIFGPTDHQLWRPLAKGSKVISADVGCIPCEQVISRDNAEEISKDCHFKCFTDILVQRVFDEIINIDVAEGEG
jgi:ADP-heptose:LPS heptosyltransferase